MPDLSRFRIAVIATDGVEEIELTEPVRVLRQMGAEVEILSPLNERVRAFHHSDKTISIPVDRPLSNELARSQFYDALFLPGGVLNADTLRSIPEVLSFVQEMQANEKPIAAICHAPWILISADVVRGRGLTSDPALRDDIVNAGGFWVDQEAVVHGNWVTSRGPDDLPVFIDEFMDLMTQGQPLMSRDATSTTWRSNIV